MTFHKMSPRAHLNYLKQITVDDHFIHSHYLFRDVAKEKVSRLFY